MLERMWGFWAWNLDSAHCGGLSTLERQQSQGRGDGVTVFPVPLKKWHWHAGPSLKGKGLGSGIAWWELRAWEEVEGR